MADRSVRVRLEAITSNFNRKISESSVLTKSFARELESVDGRMANIVQTGLALAPALVPLGAAGIPAVAGLTTQLGFAALATGTLVLGLNGVGDALTALDNYQLDPTVEHFKKLEQTIDKLGPAGGEFVLFLDQIEPRMKRVRNLAEAGLLPGVEDGLRHVLQLMPQLREVVFTTSTTLGDLVRNAGDNLDDPRWQEFFTFLETRARPTLTDMGKTAGNFALAFTNLVVAFDPLERDFSTGLLHMSQAVRDWSTGLEHTTGFQELVDYVRTNGPRALDMLGALSGALLQIVEAAAPIGAIALPIVTDLLKVVGAVADTPVIGSGLIGLAAAIGIYGRSLALLKTVGLRGSEGVLASTFSGTKGRISEATKALREFTTTQDRSAVSAKQLGTGMYLAYGDPRVRSGMKELGKGAALATGFAVAQSGVADSLGLSNTASLALMGTIGGPLGAAVGGAIGFTMDLAHANDDLESAIKRVNVAAKTTDFGEQRAALADLRTKSDAYTASVHDAWTPGGTHNPLTQIKEGVTAISDLFSHAGAEGRKAAENQGKTFSDMRKNATDLFASLNGVTPKGLNLSDDQLTAFVTKISPALQRANVDVQALLSHRSGWLDAQLAVREWVTEMDSAQGRSEAVGQALNNLQNDIIPTADAAKTLSDALDALFSPQLNQADALDRWITGLQDLRTELAKNKGVLEGNSAAALKNRDAVRGSVGDLLNRAKTDAAAGVAPQKIARELMQGRDAIIATAVAAGASRPVVERYLNRLGLTAANLNVILGGIPAKIDRISAAMRKLKDKTVTIKIRNIYEATHSSAVGSFTPGDVANQHMPELAGPGVTRVWREPETQGEAYIPLANDYRRPRAVDIWERTGQALGVQFRRFALGGITGGAAAGSAGLSDADIGRLAGALANLRPAIGTQIVQPHDYNEFRRQQENNRLAMGIGGAG